MLLRGEVAEFVELMLGGLAADALDDLTRGLQDHLEKSTRLLLKAEAIVPAAVGEAAMEFNVLCNVSLGNRYIKYIRDFHCNFCTEKR